jgi:hypothetical protein
MAMELRRGVVTYPLAEGVLRRKVRWDLLRTTRDTEGELTGWRFDNGCEGRMEEWKAPWLTTESGFTDIVIGLEVNKSGNEYESDD